MSDPGAHSLVGLVFDNPVVDAATGSISVNIRVTVIDASKIDSIEVSLQPPSGPEKAPFELTQTGNGLEFQGTIRLDPFSEPGLWTTAKVTIDRSERSDLVYTKQDLDALGARFTTSFLIPNPRATLSPVDGLTGERTLELSTIPTTLTGSDGIVDRFRLQTTAAPASPWQISGFNPIEDVLQIPVELPNRTARPTFFTVAKVVVPDRLLSKSEFKSLRMQQKAASKSAKRIGRTGHGFIYNQMTGELFIDTNGSKKGFGKDGGLLAVLEGTPSLSSSNFQLF
jgi:hypothetical protein